MRTRKTDRRAGDVLGVITPGALYDTDAVMRHAGIGEGKLLDERRAGRLQMRPYNGRNWYRGEDLIALIQSSMQETSHAGSR
jgi:hypothetical protein